MSHDWDVDFRPESGSDFDFLTSHTSHTMAHRTTQCDQQTRNEIEKIAIGISKGSLANPSISNYRAPCFQHDHLAFEQ